MNHLHRRLSPPPKARHSSVGSFGSLSMRAGELLNDFVFETDAQMLALPMVPQQFNLLFVLGTFGLAKSVHQDHVLEMWRSQSALQKD